MDTARQARVIVCERTGKWARAIAPHLPVSTSLQEVRGLTACTDELTAAPASLVVIELEPDRLPHILQWLAQLPRRFPRALVVVASGGTASLEAEVREAGAAHWVVSTRRAAEVGRLAARHLERVAPDLEGAPDEIWERLPWGPVA